MTQEYVTLEELAENRRRPPPGADGYVDISFLRDAPRIQQDVEIPGVGRCRVHALSHDEARRSKMACRIDNGAMIDVAKLATYEVAYGTIKPNIAKVTVEDEDEGLEFVRNLHPTIVSVLAAAVQDITYLEAGEAFRRFFTTATSPTG